ncbi:uncharacterized protein N7529_001561 [Penicillium soppii]|uniref:uncharacterized protein n=1 Tax=Penicillium soppii TaxID=69789 RepID=UPI0025468BDD|nr:uncharacterized protein N7529_001561 [Penicillium soppii]KAJ5875977.1 hypothetical protein N7529_001561 [Penicillium soppii]
MSGQSSVGNRARARYAEGQSGSHKNLDSKDERSIANKLASQSNKSDPSHHHNNEADKEAELSKQDPTKPAKLHGNTPSKGAQIDAELQAEDEQRLREKGIKK